MGLGGKNDIKGTKRLSPWAYTSPRQDVLAICQLIAFWETALTVANEERGKEKPVAYPGPFGALASISVLRCAGMHGIGSNMLLRGNTPIDQSCVNFLFDA